MSAEVKTYVLDGEEYQANPDFIKLFKQEKARADKAEKEAVEKEEDGKKEKADAEKMKAQMDTLKDENKALKDELEALKKKKGDSAEILTAVNKRVDLLVAAKKVGLIEGTDFKNDSADTAIKTAVVLKIYPKAELKDKTEDYLNARFDSAMDTFVSKTEADIRGVVHNDSGMPGVGSVSNEDSNVPGAAARNAREKRMREDFFVSRAEEVPAIK